MDLPKYQKKEFKKVSWEEYGKTLEILYQKVNKYLKKNNIKIDVVVPIMRGGAFPGTYLAYRLHLLKILPIQYKYFFVGKKVELRKLTDYPKTAFDIPKKAIFLLVESNHCFGNTASSAIKDLKKTFPDCKIIYAADHIDFSFQKIDNVEAIFYGKLTNETRALQGQKVSYLLPWEGLDEEWTTVQGKQFDFNCEAVGDKKLELELE